MRKASGRLSFNARSGTCGCLRSGRRARVCARMTDWLILGGLLRTALNFALATSFRRILETMNPHSKVDSPFLQAAPVTMGFGTVMIMLLTVVAAVVALLIWYALQVPAIASELNAWSGRPNPVSDTAEGRRAHVTFLLVVYSAPLALGIMVYVLNNVLAWINRRSQALDAVDDEAFRME